jgi:hypothetical protein
MKGLAVEFRMTGGGPDLDRHAANRVLCVHFDEPSFSSDLLTRVLPAGRSLARFNSSCVPMSRGNRPPDRPA